MKMALVRRLSRYCQVRQRELIFVTLILVILMMVGTRNFECTWKQPSSTSSLRTHFTTWTDTPVLQMRELLENYTTLGEKEQEVEVEISSIKQVVQDKMLFPERKVVNLHRFKYIHNVPGACHGTKVELLIGVPSRTDSFELRTAIRETWGQSRENPENRTVTVFFLGTTSDNLVQNEIDKEALKYDDIVQEDFVDTYRNLSLKSVALVKWVSLYCPNSTFVLKADEDNFVNVPLLISALQEHYRWSHLFIMGQLRSNERPFRNTTNKYHLSYDEYSFDTFPGFVTGTAYAMTTTAALRLYVETFYVQLITLEDVYLTGIVADRAGIPKFFHKGFNGRGKRKLSLHLFAYPAKRMREMQKAILDQNLV